MIDLLTVDALLITLTLGVLLTLLTYRLRWVSGIIALLSSGFAAAIIIAMGAMEELPESNLTIEILHGRGLELSFGISWFPYLFLASITVIAPLVILYSLVPMKERATRKPFYGLMLLSLLGGATVTMAQDLLSLFLAWEIMTWSALLLIDGKRKFAGRAFRIYLGFGAMSAASILAMIAMLTSRGYELDYGSITTGLSTAPDGFVIGFLILGLAAFGSKAALAPFHIWAPGAYTHSSSSFSAFFSGGLSKTGIFGVFLVVDVFIGTAVLAGFGIWNGLSGVGLIIAILGAVTALIGGIMAMFQDDAKKLLAYSSISQLGYIFVGIGVGGSMGVAGALYHVLNHTVFKTLLFMGLGAVIYRTGEHRLSRMGGMIHVMPATFWMFLVGIFAAAAIPITSGLASKWLIYESALEIGIGLVVPILFLASVSAFLYSFRILQGGFMGQLRDEFKDVKEAPLPMMIPMTILMLSLIVFAFIPGAPMWLIEKAMTDIGLTAPAYTTIELGSGVGTYSGLVVMISVMAGFAVAAILFFSGPLGRKISLIDTFTSGEEPMPRMDRRYHYAYKFYAPYERVLKPYFNNWIEKTYGKLYKGVSQIARLHRSVFNGDITAYLWLIFTTMLLVGILFWQYGGWF
ncbi:MAG: proton-conducting transporter membrane subunit [Candidatus Thermoplasmatota archaeon]|nr:proton-conducting transporter membrane subunit [Candidatus Thermoplasmatota archaeon]